MTKDMDKNDMDENVKSWEKALTIYKKYSEERKEQLADGKNNYSLINSLLKANDEVRLHSRFIYSMLILKDLPIDKSFLELFLIQLPEEIYRNICEIDDLGNVSNLETIKVLKEKDNIDLLIHNEKHFIIIENKLDANDEAHQISRYISKVKTKYNIQDSEVSKKISVVYLSKNKTEPFLSNEMEEKENYSLIGFNLNNDKTKISWDGTEKELCDNQKLNMPSGTEISFFNLKYFHYMGLSIESWINACLNYVEKENKANMTNIVYAFKEYKLILDKLNRNTKWMKVMDLQTYVANMPENKEKDRMYEFMVESKRVLPNYVGTALFNKIHELTNSIKHEENVNVKFTEFTEPNCIKWVKKYGKKEKWRNVGVVFMGKNKKASAICLSEERIYLGPLSIFDESGGIPKYKDDDKSAQLKYSRNDLINNKKLPDLLKEIELKINNES